MQYNIRMDAAPAFLIRTLADAIAPGKRSHREMVALFEANTGLIGFCMRRWRDIPEHDRGDYEAAGYRGLWRACERHDGRAAFSTYATAMIQGYIQHEHRARMREAAKATVLSLDAPVGSGSNRGEPDSLYSLVSAGPGRDPAEVLEGKEKLLDACRVWLEGYHRAKGVHRMRKVPQYEAMRLGLAEIGTTPEEVSGRPARHTIAGATV